MPLIGNINDAQSRVVEENTPFIISPDPLIIRPSANKEIVHALYQLEKLEIT